MELRDGSKYKILKYWGILAKNSIQRAFLLIFY